MKSILPKMEMSNASIHLQRVVLSAGSDFSHEDLKFLERTIDKLEEFIEFNRPRITKESPCYKRIYS